MEKWYEKVDIYENPFEPNPLRDIERELVGRDSEVKEAIYRVLSSNMLFIEGKQGSGKTAILKKVIDKFKGKGRVIYVDSRLVYKKINIEDLLRKAGGVTRRVRGAPPKKMILLIDNVDNLTPRNNERIKYYFDQNYLQAVIFTGESIKKAPISDSIRSRIGKRIIQLSPLSNKDMIDVVDQRLEDYDELLPKDVIDYVYEKSDKNLKEFMINAYKVCEAAVNSEKKNATKQIVDKVIKNEINDEDIVEEMQDEKDMIDKAQRCDICDNELREVGEYYRCDYCDSYCPKCGAVIEEDETKCPECGVKFK